MQASRSVVASSKCVFIKVSNAVRRSLIWQRGRSFAASVPSDSSKPRKAKKVPKHRRRALVESYVHKYRISNDGKFPSISLVKEHVGGSFYVIREIVQELEYEFKLSSVKNKDKVVLEMTENPSISNVDTKQESLESTKPEEISDTISTDMSTFEIANASVSPQSAVVMGKPRTDIDEAINSETNSGHVEAKGEPKVSNRQVLMEEVSDHDASTRDPFSKLIMEDQGTPSSESPLYGAHEGVEVMEDFHARISTNGNSQGCKLDSAEVQVIHSTHIGADSHQMNLETGVVSQFPEQVQGREKDGKFFGRSTDLKEEPLSKGGQEELKPQMPYLDTSKKSSSEEPAADRSTLWGNLKSLADGITDGIIGFWRRF